MGSSLAEFGGKGDIGVRAHFGVSWDDQPFPHAYVTYVLLRS